MACYYCGKLYCSSTSRQVTSREVKIMNRSRKERYDKEELKQADHIVGLERLALTIQQIVVRNERRREGLSCLYSRVMGADFAERLWNSLIFASSH